MSVHECLNCPHSGTTQGIDARIFNDLHSQSKYYYNNLRNYFLRHKRKHTSVNKYLRHKQTYHLFDEVHTPYFQEKRSTIINKQRLNTVILH